MCGIAGTYCHAGGVVGREALLAVRDAMSARGPDGAGLWMSDDGRIGLAHRRLAIIDLSEAGAQPMAWQGGRLRIAFNGEIYNHRELRAGLETKGHVFHSGSDTEVLLALYAERGPSFINALRGMFALALWDEDRQGLLLARDPFGIKPLYYADDGRTLRFASQVKALLAGGEIAADPDPAGYAGYCTLGSVPEPFTLYRAIRALPAGSTLWIDRSGARRLRAYWSLREVLSGEGQAPMPANLSALGNALQDSMRHHMVSDVPVGLFLSAGLDSSMLAALASAEGGRIDAITLGFQEYAGTPDDEVPAAEETARFFGMRHEIHRIGREEFRAHGERLLQAMDQPSIDGVNTYFVSLAARRAGLKVALSGLGGDEWFAGYPSFRDVPRLAALPRWGGTGRWLRRLSAPLVSRLSSPKYAGLLEYGGSYAGGYLLRRALHMPWELGRILDPAFAAQGWRDLALMERLEETVAGIASPRLKVTALELSWYMRNQLLRDADWAGMAHSVEIRVPFVDAEFARRIAPHLAVSGAPGKREVAHALPVPLPGALLNRPKTGFSVPVRQWLLDEGPRDGAERGLRSWSRRVLEHLAGAHSEVWAQ